MENISCEICCNAFSKSKCKKIVCPFCNFECCSKCVENYLFFTANDLHCMKCKKIWSRRIMASFFPKTGSMQKKWNARRSEIILESQKKYLASETQDVIQYYGKIRIEKNDIQLKMIKLKEEMCQYDVMLLKSRKILCEENCMLTKNSIRDLKRKKNSEYRSLEKIYYNLDQTLGRIQQGCETHEKEKIEKKSFIHPCAAPNCKGFLSTAWKCGLCNFYTCSKCFDFMGLSLSSSSEKEHICTEDSVKSAEEIKRNGKKCPNCGVFIMRISGCDTMFCTYCHVGFNWSTLQILTNGIVYNPHFFEYDTRRPPEEAQLACGNNVNYGQLTGAMKEWKYNAQNDFTLFSGEIEGNDVIVNDFFFKNYLFALHERDEHELQAWQRENDLECRFRRLRFLYMMNLLTLDELKKRLLSLDKLQSIYAEIIQILEMHVVCSKDIFRQLIDMKITPMMVFSQIYSLECYIQQVCDEVCRIYCTKKRPNGFGYKLCKRVLLKDNEAALSPRVILRETQFR